MGSETTLGIDKYEIEWARNGLIRNHSVLFWGEKARKMPYYYADNIIEPRLALSKKLGDLKNTFELLGYTLNNVKKEFLRHSKWFEWASSEMSEITYEVFFETLTNLRIDGLESEFPEQKTLDLYGFLGAVINKTANAEIYPKGHLQWDFFAGFDPYCVLRVLAENPENLSKDIVWRYFDVLEGGYVPPGQFKRKLERKDKILIVTEGSSDANIIQKSLQLLNPDISHFFTFIDMTENYPFTGIGNLTNFVKGLAKIEVSNRILVLFDNDTEGLDKYRFIRNEIPLPRNIRIIKLPDLPEFTKFKARGPNGNKRQNINGKAVSIELFLDLNYHNQKEPVVHWRNFNPKAGKYHGVLDDKEHHTKVFLNLKAESQQYDLMKLSKLNQFLIAESGKLNEKCSYLYHRTRH